jgi:hypothetical protein
MEKGAAMETNNKKQSNSREKDKQDAYAAKQLHIHQQCRLLHKQLSVISKQLNMHFLQLLLLNKQFMHHTQ